MNLKKGEIVEVKIERLAFGGAGVGRHDGRVIFVENVVPGDLVRASLRRIKEKFMEADLVEVVKESEMRCGARCKHFEVCGGCRLQFIPYEEQVAIKRQQVVDAFERIGSFDDPPVLEVLECEAPYFYRNKMEFSFGYDGEMLFAFGLHLPGRRFDILDVEECFLQSERSVEVVSRVREFVKERWDAGWLPYRYSCDEGFLMSLFVRESKRTGEMMLNLKTSDQLPEDLDWSDFVKMGRELGATSIYWTKVVNKKGRRKEFIETHLDGLKVLNEELGGLKFEISPQAFFQVNTKQAELLYGEALSLIGDKKGVVFDLFCGTGTISLFLARGCEQVFGIDINESAIKSARENARLNGIENVEFYSGDAREIVESLKVKPEAIVVDPPRAGLGEKLVEVVAGFEVEKIVYVSCNPTTLARDCKQFDLLGYELISVRPVDMFPQTFHIENVVLLKKK